MTPHTNSFKVLGSFISSRLCTPLGHVSFWAYIILAIVLFGAAGIWVELVRLLLKANASEFEGILTAIYTYFPAIAVGAAVQLIMDRPPKPVASFTMVWVVFSLVLVIPYSVGLVQPDDALRLGVVGSVMAFLMWWVANGANPSYLDSSPEDTLGATPTSEPAGDTSNFTV